MDTILNPMLNTAIDNLSDSDSDMEEYSLEKGYERTLIMLKPKERLIAPHTEKDLAELIQLRHVTRWLINLIPETFQTPFKKARTLHSAMVMRMRGSPAFTKATLIFNLSIGVFSLIFHCLYLISFSWQFILTSLHSLVLYSDNFWTWLLDDRKTPSVQAAEFEQSDRASYSTWRDSYDIRNTEYVQGEGDTINPSKSMVQVNKPIQKPPQGTAVNGATALKIVRSQISNVSNTDVRTEPTKPVNTPQKAAPAAAPAFNMTVQSSTTPADSSSAPESKPKSPTTPKNNPKPPSVKSSSSSLKSLDSFHPTVFTSSSSSNSSTSSKTKED